MRRTVKSFLAAVLQSLGKPTQTEINAGWDRWFEHLREDGRKLGVDVEPLTVCERVYLEYDASVNGGSVPMHHKNSLGRFASSTNSTDPEEMRREQRTSIIKQVRSRR
jgi:hypothetical protein